MAGIITAIKYQKYNKDRASVYIDGEYAFGLAAILAARLVIGQELTRDDIARLKGCDEVERAYERALNYVSYRPRSEVEIRRNLREKYEEGDIDAVIKRLEDVGLVDDVAFAQYWVENRLHFRPRGLRALRYELHQKGIADSIISSVLVEVDELQAAREVAESALRRFRHLSPSDFRRKLEGYLARRGFSYQVVGPLIEDLLESIRCGNQSDIESEEMNNA
jgi:regulatory protein